MPVECGGRDDCLPEIFAPVEVSAAVSLKKSPADANWDGCGLQVLPR